MWDKKNFVIEFRNIDVLQDQNIILNAVNLQIKANEFVLLSGTNGSGKSSLIKILTASIPFSSGEARVYDFELKKIKPKFKAIYRRTIGLVSYDYPLIKELTVEGNLKLILKSYGWRVKDLVSERIREVLDLVKLNHKLLSKAEELSKAEYQKIALARAMINKPSILILDEPLSNLDEESGHSFMKIIDQICKNNSVTILFASNNAELYGVEGYRTIKIDSGNLISE
jgi:cell division transport system ATP-binding protein